MTAALPHHDRCSIPEPQEQWALGTTLPPHPCNRNFSARVSYACQRTSYNCTACEKAEAHRYLNFICRTLNEWTVYFIVFYIN